MVQVLHRRIDPVRLAPIMSGNLAKTSPLAAAVPGAAIMTRFMPDEMPYFKVGGRVEGSPPCHCQDEIDLSGNLA
jgi:hypothetical protein